MRSHQSLTIAWFIYSRLQYVGVIILSDHPWFYFLHGNTSTPNCKSWEAFSGNFFVLVFFIIFFFFFPFLYICYLHVGLEPIIWRMFCPTIHTLNLVCQQIPTILVTVNYCLFLLLFVSWFYWAEFDTSSSLWMAVIICQKPCYFNLTWTNG